VMLAVKAWQVDDIAPQLPALLGDETRYLTLQNGVEAPEIVAAAVGKTRTLGGLVRGFFELEAPGYVRHGGVQPAIIFGQLDGTRTPPAERLLAALIGSGVHAELAADIDAALWEKFLLVASLS